MIRLAVEVSKEAGGTRTPEAATELSSLVAELVDEFKDTGDDGQQLA